VWPSLMTVTAPASVRQVAAPREAGARDHLEVREAEGVVRADGEDDVRRAGGAQERVGGAGAAAVMAGLQDVGPESRPDWANSASASASTSPASSTATEPCTRRNTSELSLVERDGCQPDRRNLDADAAHLHRARRWLAHRHAARLRSFAQQLPQPPGPTSPVTHSSPTRSWSSTANSRRHDPDAGG